MTGVIRYRESEETGDNEVYDVRCTDCIDFASTWGLDREARFPEDEDAVCVYCHHMLFESDPNRPEEIVQYAEGFTFVNVYEVDRAYGGPEEGGWYYDTGRLITSRQVPAESAYTTRDELVQKYPKGEGRKASWSVLYCGGDYRVYVEDHPGADFPEHTPHYE